MDISKTCVQATEAFASLKGSISGDRLMDIGEASRVLGMSDDWLYKNAKKLPFALKLGRVWRFSEKGIANYIAKKVNLEER